MRDDAQRLGLLAWQDPYDVRHPRRAAQLVAACVGFLNPHLEAELLQLVDNVFTRPCVGSRAHRPAADRAGEHADVSDGVGVVEETGLP